MKVETGAIHSGVLVEFGTKAQTLERLRPLLKGSTVLPQVHFTVKDWASDPETCLDRIRLEFLSRAKELIVRSSSLTEDAETGSNAGRFESVMGVLVEDRESIREAVNRVIESFKDEQNLHHQVLIQPQIRKASMSGVIFTRELDTLAPYFVVNYDDQTSQTDTVTGGRSNKLKTLVLFRGAPVKRHPRFQKLLAAVEEIEKVLACDSLDIEFAVTSSGDIYIFQVRPIAKRDRPLPSTEEIGRYLEKLHKKIEKLNRPHPYLYGDRTLLGVMPDWNPAEMIGVKPRPLALSLYKQLITDRTWAYQRDNYGYKNLRSYPLMVSLLGHPYIDVRVSANSFIPKGVSDELSHRLANYYVESLEAHPSHHDKIEFEIIFSCYFFGIEERLEKLRRAGFTEKDTRELKRALQELTNRILMPDRDGVFQTDLRKIELLKARQDKVIHSSLSILEKIYWLMEDCCRYGTLPFAGLARAAFISTQILRSFVEGKLILRDELDQFMSSLNTIAKQMTGDRSHLTREAFLARYGHLRPGTYDILSDRYDENYELYFGDGASPSLEKSSFDFDGKKKTQLDAWLMQEGFSIKGDQLVQFLKQAIESREYSKFVFTRSVSEVLVLVKELARGYGLDSDDASFIDVRTLMNLYATLDHRDLEEILREEIERNRRFYEVTKQMRLPALIVKADDIYEFELEEGEPNFITLGRCQGEVLKVEGPVRRSLSEKIVFIPSADPGYDWIFTKNIRGLVTIYGGANSHMAVRAAELKIPAVIGAGEKNYSRWSRAQVLEIDSGNRQVKLIR